MDTEVITKELQAFNTTDAAIAVLRKEYMVLTIEGLEDKEGLEKVHKARMDCKTRRVAVTKRGKELREDAVKFQKSVIEEEKRIISMLQPIEDHLNDEENRVNEELAKIKAEAEEAERARIQARANMLFSMGCAFDGENFHYGIQILPQTLMRVCTDDQFASFCEKIQEAINIKKAEEAAEAERIAKIEAEQKRIAAEQAAERARLAQEAKALQEARDAMDREKNAAEEAKLKAEQDKLRAIEIENVKKEAALKAESAMLEKIRRETEEAAAKKRAADIAAEKKAARRPDKEKILAYSRAISDIPLPELRHAEFTNLLVTAVNDIGQTLADLNKRMEEL